MLFLNLADYHFMNAPVLRTGMPDRFFPYRWLCFSDKPVKAYKHRHIHEQEIVGYIKRFHFDVPICKKPASQCQCEKYGLDQQNNFVKTSRTMVNQEDIRHQKNVQAQRAKGPSQYTVGNDLLG